MTLDAYDPWLEHRLRLADRRGILTGPNLSPVQVYALDLLLVLESREDRNRREEALRQAILSANPDRYFPLLYPDAVTEKVSAEDISENTLMEESEGEWEMPEDMDPRDAEQLLAEMLRDPGGSMTMDDIEQHQE